MILCLCQGISDRTVQAVIGAGAGTLDDVAAECGAGSDCGACQDMLLDLLDEARARGDAGMTEPEASRSDSRSVPAASRLRMSSRDLFRGQREIVILHAGNEYRLRITRADKLILTK